MNNDIEYEEISPYVFVTKLAGFEHSEYIQPNATKIPMNTKDIPMVQGKNIRGGEFVEKYDWYIKKEISDSLPRSILNKRCILIPYVGSNLGEVGIFPNKYVCHLASNIAKVELNSDKYLLEYMKYYMQSPIGQSYLFQAKQGSSQPNITMESIRKTKIIKKTINEQIKIVSILSSIDAQIKRNNDMVQKLQVLTQSIYSYWFNQFEFPNEEGKSYKSSGGEMIWNEELKREIPKDWSINTVKNYCNITWGQCPDGINILPLSYNDENTFLYCSGAGDMRNGIVVDCQAKTNASKRLAHKNDILMSIAGSIGALCICDKTISLGRAAVAFTQKENQSLLTYQLINVFATRMKSVSSGSIQKVINDNHLNDIKFAFSKEIFELYTSKFNSILEVIINFEHKNKELVHLKEKMLPLLINGQLI